MTGGDATGDVSGNPKPLRLFTVSQETGRIKSNPAEHAVAADRSSNASGLLAHSLGGHHVCPIRCSKGRTLLGSAFDLRSLDPFRTLAAKFWHGLRMITESFACGVSNRAPVL